LQTETRLGTELFLTYQKIYYILHAVYSLIINMANQHMHLIKWYLWQLFFSYFFHLPQGFFEIKRMQVLHAWNGCGLVCKSQHCTLW